MSQQGGYMDEVKVKIAEKYKPPPKINLAMSYAQRLSLNKQIQDTIPGYAFDLEKTVLEKMNEWKNARSEWKNSLEERLKQSRNEIKKVEDPQEEIETEVNFPTMNSYSNILTPIPLKEQNIAQYKSPDKSPFNISDFEADTSSPFDNMELKSINDLEELAQVLKPTGTASYPMGVPSTFSYTIPNSTSYIQPTTSLYNNTNGYYYPPETIQTSQSHYAYTNHVDNKIYSSSPVQDIMKSLQNHLDNTHLVNRKSENVCTVTKTKSEDLSEEFVSLPRNLQEMSKSISLMGFPLSRVARVCTLIGNDQKKIVDHLLVMSELLDLGFPESKVSKALLECDNDRDKALDVLIS